MTDWIHSVEANNAARRKCFKPNNDSQQFQLPCNFTETDTLSEFHNTVLFNAAESRILCLPGPHAGGMSRQACLRSSL